MIVLQLTQEEARWEQVLSAVWIIAAVDLGMAIQATASLFDEGVGLRRSRDSRCDARDTRCTVAAVALVADQRWARLQQVVGGGTVRHVAVGAVVADRTMVMHERTAFFHVTGVASLDHRVALHQLRTRRAVRIMAIGAAHFPFQYGMVRLFVDLCALFLVAGETHFGLRAFVANIVMCGMHLVA